MKNYHDKGIVHLANKFTIYLSALLGESKLHNYPLFNFFVTLLTVRLGGLGVTCSPRDPMFACSNPSEVEGFFQDVKILSTSPPGRTLSSSLKK